MPAIKLEIDPANLIDNQDELLFALFQSNPEKQVFSKDKSYKITVKSSRRKINYEIQLSNHIIRRDKKIHENDIKLPRYDLIDTENMGKGSFGTVFLILGTLMPAFNHKMRYKPDNKHVVKIQLAKNNDHYNAIKEEHHFLNRGYRHRPKEVLGPPDFNEYCHDIPYYILSRKFNGIRLSAIIAAENDKHRLSIDQCFQLSLSLLIALQEQVHHLGLVHRDIKPGNIIVDLATMDVNIIDYGSCRTSEINDQQIHGSRGFAPPEIATLPYNIDKQSDIFSTGRVISLIWGDSCCHTKDEAKAMQEKIISSDLNYDSLFTRLHASDLNKDTSEKIKDIITSMTAYEKAKRPLNLELIQEFHEIYLSWKNPDMSKDKIQELNTAFLTGLKTRLSCPSIHDFPEFIIQLKVLQNTDPDYVYQFAEGLGWSVLKASTSKRELIESAKKVMTEYQDTIADYSNLLLETEALSKKINASESFSSLDGIKNELLTFTRELSDKIYRLNHKHFPLHQLDSIKNEKKNSFSHWENRLGEINSAFIENETCFQEEMDKFESILPVFNRP